MCPECKNPYITLIGSVDGETENSRIEKYRCSKCGCEWQWEMTRVVTKHGNIIKVETQQ